MQDNIRNYLYQQKLGERLEKYLDRIRGRVYVRRFNLARRPGSDGEAMRNAFTRAAVLLMVVACTLAAAQTRPPTRTRRRGRSRAGGEAGAGRRQPEPRRWLTTIIIVVLFASALAVWRIWSLGRKVARLEDLRAAWIPGSPEPRTRCCG